MKFYGNGIVWPVGRFVDGVFETEDPKLIEQLKRAGFKYEEPPKTKNKKGAIKK